MTSSRDYPEGSRDWVHGWCYPFALALHERTGWPLRGLTAIREERRGVQVAHLWCVRPDGSPVDAAGIFDEDALCDDFLDGEEQSTKDSARRVDFADREAFLNFTREAEGDFYDEAVGFLDRMAGKARDALDAFASRHLCDVLEDSLEMEP